MTPQTRVCRFLQKSLAPKGFDVIIPLSVESYNAYLDTHAATAASPLERFKLPIASDDTLSSHLMVLIGNSRAMWKPFLQFVDQDRKQNSKDGHIRPHPVDRFVQQSIHETLQEMMTAQHDDAILSPEKIYWVADTEPGKMILAQKMALAAHAVSHCPPSQICLHPVFGPWLAFRCALIFGVEADNIDTWNQQMPPLCSHDHKLHDTLAAQMECAYAQSKNQFGTISRDAWKVWALPRITMAPNHVMMYPPEQILYHYTKDLAFLERVVDAHNENRCRDYLRDSPSQKVIECRKLMLQVLSEYQQQYPSGVGGILLSGGLDTSILAEASAQILGGNTIQSALLLDKTGPTKPLLRFRYAFTVQASEDAQDAVFAGNIYQRLRGISLDNHHILHVTLEELLTHAPQVTKILGTCDPMELRNSLVIYAALVEASKFGVKEIMTGDGADEIFCGYSFYYTMDKDALLAYRKQIIQVMQFTASKLAEALGMRVLSPFLDERVIQFAQTLSKADLIGERTPVPIEGADVQYGKLVLRQAFPEAFSQWRWKEPIEKGSGTTALRMGYFDNKWSDREFQQHQKTIYKQHHLFVRDREHLFFVKAFLNAFEGQLTNVPRRRFLPFRNIDEDREVEEKWDVCPACYFELSHPEQDFCVTCGFWPTRCTPTNDTNGYATKALKQLAQAKEQLLN